MPQNTNEIEKELRENLEEVTRILNDFPYDHEDTYEGMNYADWNHKWNEINAQLKGIALGRQLEREEQKSQSQKLVRDGDKQEGVQGFLSTSTPSCLSNEEQEARRKR